MINPQEIFITSSGAPLVPNHVLEAWLDQQEILDYAIFAATNPGCQNDDNCRNSDNSGRCTNDVQCGGSSNGSCHNYGQCVADGPIDP